MDVLSSSCYTVARLWPDLFLMATAQQGTYVPTAKKVDAPLYFYCRLVACAVFSRVQPACHKKHFEHKGRPKNLWQAVQKKNFQRDIIYELRYSSDRMVRSLKPELSFDANNILNTTSTFTSTTENFPITATAWMR